MEHSRNVMQTYQDPPCLQLTPVCKLVVMLIGDTDYQKGEKKAFPGFWIGKQMNFIVLNCHH